jgi:hypothetical protein
MAKNNHRLRHILFACALSCYPLLHAQVDEISFVYLSQVGVREKTGANDGEPVERYLASVGLSKGNPWCAAFVHWVLTEAGIKDLPRSGYSPSWFPRARTFYQTGKNNSITPSRADVFGIYFASKGRIAHVGFIDSWPPSSTYCLTVEGNTNEAGSREGDGVFFKRRLKKQIYKVSRWHKNM